MTTENLYFTEGHDANSKDVVNMYPEAMKELALPAPAIHLIDFPGFDHAIGGFRAREFTILCGATGVGKTALLANWSASLLKQKVPHFVASVETGATDYVKRVMSVLCDKDINDGEAVRIEDLKKIHEKVFPHINKDILQLSLYDNRCSVETLMADIEWHVKHKRCGLAIIDNLNFFLEVTSAANSIVEMDRVIHELIIFCKRVDCHVVMVMHPKKTENGRIESELEIKGSSTAVQEAHNVLLFNRPKKERIEAGYSSPSDRELKIAKLRRRGRWVGKSSIIKCENGTKYTEGAMY